MELSIVPTFINTIRRLQKRDRGGDPVWRRKSGTGMKKSYGVKEITAIRKSIKKNPFMTSYQIKLRQKKELKNISPRTIQRILLEDLGRRAVVAKKKPFLFEVNKRERLDWCRLHLKIVQNRCSGTSQPPAPSSLGPGSETLLLSLFRFKMIVGLLPVRARSQVYLSLLGSKKVSCGWMCPSPLPFAGPL